MERVMAWTETAARLWPADTPPTVIHRPDGQPDERAFREFVFLPNAANPRMLLPAGTPRAAASALRRYSHGLGWRERATRHFLAAALHARFPERLLPDRLRLAHPHAHPGDVGSIEDYLSEVLGARPYLSLRLGNPRANRKPVLHALSATGTSLAFVKVGVTEVARSLVWAETGALRDIGSRRWTHLTPPQVLHSGTWSGLEILVVSSLETTARRWKGRRALPIAAMHELATVNGLDRQALADSDFWQKRTAVPAQLHSDHAARSLSSILERIEASYGDTRLEMGAWHGDWTPWNMAWWRQTVQLWDWERFDRGVPYGFDFLHYQLQDRLRSGELTTTGMQRWRAGARGTLEPLGLAGRPARATVAAYLLELCCRYLLAAQEPAGEPLRARAQWLLGFLHETSGSL